MVEHDSDGLLVNFQQEQELALAIINLLHYPVRARAMGEAGKQKVLEKYTWSKIARQFRSIYAQVIDSRQLSD